MHFEAKISDLRAICCIFRASLLAFGFWFWIHLALGFWFLGLGFTFVVFWYCSLQQAYNISYNHCI
jgi:hypothetical protein